MAIYPLYPIPMYQPELKMTKNEVMERLNKVIFHDSKMKIHYTKQHVAKIRELNVMLIESCMPFSDPVTQRRAIGTIANLERQIRV